MSLSGAARCSLRQARSASAGSTIALEGWVRSVRKQKRFAFLELNDGSSFANMQVVAAADMVDGITTGSSVRVEGTIAQHKGSVEVQADDVALVGECSAADYPLQKKQHSNEFMREILHLRPRSRGFSSVMRVRSASSSLTHRFFESRGYLHIHTPILTQNDAEGAGELFQVDTAPANGSAGVDTSNTGEGRDSSGEGFFDAPTFLTVSGQLQAEMFACSLSQVYTFGPTFRAENSNTSRHLAEFWMVEPEFAFGGLDDAIELAESCVRFLLSGLLERHDDDLEGCAVHADAEIDANGQPLMELLSASRDKSFARLSYTEAVDILQRSDQSFVHSPEWGAPLQAEHERFLADQYCQCPVFVTHYPAATKPFYMRRSEGAEDGKRATVDAVDLLMPGLGELIGGSAREERLDVLERNMREAGMHVPKPGDQAGDHLQWYLDLRRYGTVKHAGWGMGFDRFVQFATGSKNIRDVNPVPRYPKWCKF